MHDPSRPTWWLDEVAHAGAEHLDEKYVAGYERKAAYDPSEDVAALRASGIGGDSTIVDLGAGTGVFAMAMAPHCRRLVVVDVSPAMVDVLRAKADGAGADHIEVVRMGYLDRDLDAVIEPGSVDAVFSRNALHQVPDFWKVVALVRIARMLRPGGILRLRDLTYEMEPVTVEEEIEAWIAGALVDDRQLGYTAAELAEHVRLEHSTFTWLLEPMIERCGFEILDRDVRRSAYVTYTCRVAGRESS
ncbi:MAG: methyltransferase domain-containing protein [Ilumatobacteraceae bacterium]